MTVDHAHVLATSWTDRHSAYVGMSQDRADVPLHRQSKSFIVNGRVDSLAFTRGICSVLFDVPDPHDEALQLSRPTTFKTDIICRMAKGQSVYAVQGTTSALLMTPSMLATMPDRLPIASFTMKSRKPVRIWTEKIQKNPAAHAARISCRALVDCFTGVSAFKLVITQQALTSVCRHLRRFPENDDTMGQADPIVSSARLSSEC